MRNPKATRRYKLHQHLKKVGVRYAAKERIIFLPQDGRVTKREAELKANFNYTIQYTIT